MDQSSHDAFVAAIEAEEHPEWGEHDRSILDRLEPRFVVVTWLQCVAATLAFSALVAGVFLLVSDATLTGSTGTELGVPTIIAALSTFIGFSAVMSLRLVDVEHDRLVNSLAVGALHVGVSLVILLIEVVGRTTGDFGVSTVFEGSFGTQLGNAATLLERSSAAAIVACLLAVGVVPARGGRPAGTQHGSEQDAQL